MSELQKGHGTAAEDDRGMSTVLSLTFRSIVTRVRRMVFVGAVVDT